MRLIPQLSREAWKDLLTHCTRAGLHRGDPTVTLAAPLGRVTVTGTRYSDAMDRIANDGGFDLAELLAREFGTDEGRRLYGADALLRELGFGADEQG